MSLAVMSYRGWLIVGWFAWLAIMLYVFPGRLK